MASGLGFEYLQAVRLRFAKIDIRAYEPSNLDIIFSNLLSPMFQRLITYFSY